MRMRATSYLALLVAVVISIPVAASAETIVSLLPAADADVNSLNPNVNYGMLEELTISPDNYNVSRHTCLLFDLTSIPPNAIIQQATLTMVAFDGWAYGGDGTVYVHRVPADAWGETTITWSNKPDWSVDVLGSWWLWYNNVSADQNGSTSTPALTAAVQQELAGDGLLSLKLRSPGYETRYRSREHVVLSQ